MTFQNPKVIRSSWKNKGKCLPCNQYLRQGRYHHRTGYPCSNGTN